MSLSSILALTGKVFLYGWPLMIAASIVFLHIKWKKWPIEAIIFEKRGSNLVKTNDRAGKFVDSMAGITGYKLFKAKDTIPIYEYDWVLHNVAVPTNLFEKFINLIRGNSGTIILFKYGSRQYKPINIKEGNKVDVRLEEIKNKKGESIMVYGYYPLDPRDKLNNLDFEVVDWDNMNFMIQEQRASIERRKRQKDWMFTIGIPAMMIAGAALVALLMLKFSFDYGQVLRQPVPVQAPKVQTSDIPFAEVIPGA